MEEIIRVFPRRTKWTPTDELAFFDEPPLFDLPDLPVYVSVTFTWDRRKGLRLYKAWSKRFKDVRIGGPAFDDPGGKYTRGRFLMRAVTITSRGCPKGCPWCLVPQREGRLRELSNISEGWVVQDNNLLACSRGHIERVFDMLRRQPIAASFPGGLDLNYIQTWHIDLLKTIKVSMIFTAFDTEKSLEKLDMAADLFADFHIDKRRAYCLIGFNGDSPYHAEQRLEKVYQAGFLPFAMLNKSPIGKIDYSNDWLKLQRKWSRPAAYRGRTASVRD
jgi:hypothetical protein